MKLKTNWTILRIFCLIYLTSILIYTIIHYRTLSDGEGWGVVYMIGLSTPGFLGLILDFILSRFIKNKIILNAIGIFLILGFLVSLYYELN